MPSSFSLASPRAAVPVWIGRPAPGDVTGETADDVDDSFTPAQRELLDIALDFAADRVAGKGGAQ